jgi:hypothetical protein
MPPEITIPKVGKTPEAATQHRGLSLRGKSKQPNSLTRGHHPHPPSPLSRWRIGLYTKKPRWRMGFRVFA